jgi:uncharacterized membrane-anchored protein YitT (DUF2179 family)
MKKNITAVISIFAGALLGAIAFKCVLLPNGLISGGLGGIALLISKFININIQIILAVLCLPIAIWAYIKYGIKQIISAISCFTLFTVFLGIVNTFIPAFKTDSILASVLSGVIFGISGGVVLRLGYANGPESLVGLYIKNKYNVPIGVFFTVVNIIIVCTSLLYSNLEMVLYSFISIYISGKVTDYIILGFRKYYEVNIVSDKYIEITEYIHSTLNRGATFVQCLGTYDLKKRMMIKSLVSNSEIILLKEYAKSVDKNCFIYINESFEVVGRGFSE